MVIERNFVGFLGKQVICGSPPASLITMAENWPERYSKCGEGLDKTRRYWFRYVSLILMGG